MTIHTIKQLSLSEHRRVGKPQRVYRPLDRVDNLVYILRPDSPVRHILVPTCLVGRVADLALPRMCLPLLYLQHAQEATVAIRRYDRDLHRQRIRRRLITIW